MSSRVLSIRLDRELKMALGRAFTAAQRVDPDVSEAEIAREALRRGLDIPARPDQEGKNRAFSATMKRLVAAIREETDDDG